MIAPASVCRTEGDQGVSLSQFDAILDGARSLLNGASAGPPVAFYFKVVVDGALSSDNAFQEVSGIQSEIQTEAVEEGGNPFTYALPTKIKNSNLVLKRGIAGASSSLARWCSEVMEGAGFARPIVPVDIQVLLMNESGIPVRIWSFTNAYPVKWEMEALSSTKNEIAIERIEFAYTMLKREM